MVVCNGDGTDEKPCQDLEYALAVIKSGGVVAFPTETYYGLAVDPFNIHAVERLFHLKKRPTAKPLLTLISKQSQLDQLTPEIPPLYIPLMSLWPCPLTLVFKAHASLSSLVTGNTGTVAARISPHPLANMLVSRLEQPVTATSANISGFPAAVSAEEVRAAFGNSIDYILDGGRTPGGEGSTLIGLEGSKLVLIRRGVIEFEILAEITKEITP
ncbi:MAG: threonylcarbamoyl-AMP synthase [Desulfobulbaceae bacterium]|nr:threonylcarbamoyl-AMP synthase [Desulfobulbaceae bacterium]